jgi:hypothetical protein
MNRGLSGGMIAAGALVALAVVPAEAGEPAHSGTFVLTGTLEGGMMGIGGEHSGFVLKDVQVEVDVSQLEDAADLAGEQVRLLGSFELKPYVERGPTWIFRAADAKPASDTSPFPFSLGPPPEQAEQERILEQLRRLAQADPEFREQALLALQPMRGQPVPR